MNFFITFLAVFLMLGAEAEAAERGSVIGVSRPLRMRNADPLPAREFFIDLGRRDGVREGMPLEVIRTISIADGRNGATGYPMRLVLGEIVLVGVDEAVSWGRVSRRRSPKELPTLDLASIAIGDEVRSKTGLP